MTTQYRAVMDAGLRPKPAQHNSKES